MKIPAQATPDIQQSFREVWDVLEVLLSRNLDMGRRRVVNAGESVSPGDYVTRFELERAVQALEAKIGQSVP